MTAVSPDPDAAKDSLRVRAAQARCAAAAALPPVEAGRLLAVTAAPLVPAAAVVAGYWPMGDEIDPRPLMECLAGRGCSLALPVVEGRAQPLLFRRWRAGEPLEPGAHGTRHPLAAAEAVIPSVLLVPLLAFDRLGWRLGYGGGYYDRTLDLLRGAGQIMVVGLAYAAQQVEAVPHDGHDQRLDAVATEQGVMVMERS